MAKRQLRVLVQQPNVPPIREKLDVMVIRSIKQLGAPACKRKPAVEKVTIGEGAYADMAEAEKKALKLLAVKASSAVSKVHTRNMRLHEV